MRIGAAAAWAAGLLLGVTAGEAKVVEQTLDYPAGEVACRGYVARDDAAPAGLAPGVLVVHDWTGLGDFTKERTRALAGLGYVALAADMYGGGKVAADPREAGALASATRGTVMRTRVVAAFEALRALPGVDPRRLAAIGFCFGGSAVLQLAYTGADARGVVSFHGGLMPPDEADLGRVRAKVLILHGAADPHVKPESVLACLEGLDRAKADWQLVAYSGAVHAFTNPAAGNDPSRGAAYHEVAARRSWAAMRGFFGELFGPPPA